mmetsp:Transcript_29466/g.33902  ORF Transcript_29466/g.33902 Transcript_29466/m.33902 type:complete len:485 (-) Transcript_29466:22-1476(-)
MGTNDNKNDDNARLKFQNGTIAAFDDGHIPDTQIENGPSKIVQNQRKQSKKFLEVSQNVLDEDLADTIYDLCMKKIGGSKAWGTYVTILDTERDDIPQLSELVSLIDYHNGEPNIGKSMEKVQHALAVMVVRQFLLNKNAPVRRFLSDDIASGAIHGVGVWALSSCIDTQVEYHIDYAEMIRYEHNIIIPPMYGGTLHCTRGKIGGGEFCVNNRGLEHYELHGYKGKKCPILNLSEEEGWVKIPYQFNQGIFHDGDFPHCSMRLASTELNRKRVIVGLNVFGIDSGYQVQLAPEHSSAFNRRVRMYQTISKMQCPVNEAWTPADSKSNITSRSKNAGINLDKIKQNKGLSKLLVLAKRAKVRQEYLLEQQKVITSIQEAIDEADVEGKCLVVAELIDIVQKRFFTSDTSISNRLDGDGSSVGFQSKPPKKDDILVHINSLVCTEQEAKLNRISVSSGDKSSATCENGFIIPSAILCRVANSPAS